MVTYACVCGTFPLTKCFLLAKTGLLLNMMSEPDQQLSPFSSMTVASGWAALGRAGADRVDRLMRLLFALPSSSPFCHFSLLQLM